VDAKKDPPGSGAPDAQRITTRDGKPYEVPVEGDLSLLALGYRGLMAWRAKRIAAVGAAEEKTRTGS
jgi:hypothetical protein